MTRLRHRIKRIRKCSVLVLALGHLAFASTASSNEPNSRHDGYQGIWFTLGQMGEFGDKYSGGLGTYTAKHRPIAIYAQEVNKTFFVYGGARDGKRYLLNMIGYYDHATGMVPKPVIVHDTKGEYDPHDNSSERWVLIGPSAGDQSAAERPEDGIERRSQELHCQIIAAKQHAAAKILVTAEN